MHILVKNKIKTAANCKQTQKNAIHQAAMQTRGQCMEEISFQCIPRETI